MTKSLLEKFKNFQYRRKENTKPNVVEWRMAAPQKQPLISVPAKTTTHGIVRRASVSDKIIFIYIFYY